MTPPNEEQVIIAVNNIRKVYNSILHARERNPAVCTHIECEINRLDV